MADGSKTEKATPKRRRDERKKGNVFLSRDAVAVATLIGAGAMLWILSGAYVEKTAEFLTICLETCKKPIGDVFLTVQELGIKALWVCLFTFAPVALASILCAVIATFAQTRLLVSFELLRPKFNRLNPLEGFKRLFSLKSVIEALKGILKIVILMILIYNNLVDLCKESIKYLYNDPAVSVSHLVQSGISMVLQIILAFVVLAAADFFYQWWEYERQLRMSKQEIKEEFKQTEGDPQVKGKIKEIQRRRAQMRMMQQVPQADVVIRNPTHFAVALRYKPDKDNAPIVLAKGQDELALRIVRTAEEHHVAVIENVPLARKLYAEAELNQEIPAALYGAVAEVLVYIFRLNDKKQIVK